MGAASVAQLPGLSLPRTIEVAVTAPPPAKPLTMLQQRFVAEFVIDCNASAAYVRAGGAPKHAKQAAHDLMKKTEIKVAIAEAQRECLERTGLSADMLLLQLYDIATADPRELSELRRACCRYCWGRDHRYHWTTAEFDRETRKAEALNTRPKANPVPMPECEGGLDFDRTRDPNPKCPECRGEGYEREFFHDSRKLTGKAARLFGGVKRTKDGIEVLMQSQEKAREMLAKHYGLLKDRMEMTGKDGAPLQSAVIILPSNGRD